MTSVDLLAELKFVLGESEYDGAWTDSFLYGQLAEGQDKFCEKTGFFIDKTNFTLNTVNGTSSYSLDSRIIEVLSVWNGKTRLGHFTEADKVPAVEPLDSGQFPSDSGTPTSWQTDQQTGSIEFWPTPDAAITLTLRVWRYPLNELSAVNNPEIPRQFHRACLEYAAYKSLSVHDMELQDKVKANDHLANFMSYVREGIQAFNRLRNTPARVGPNPAYTV